MHVRIWEGSKFRQLWNRWIFEEAEAYLDFQKRDSKFKKKKYYFQPFLIFSSNFSKLKKYNALSSLPLASPLGLFLNDKTLILRLPNFFFYYSQPIFSPTEGY